MTQHLVSVLAYDGLCTFEFGCAVEIFGLHRPELEVPWYRFTVCSDATEPVRARGGVTVSATHSLAMLTRADTIIIPGWRDAEERPPERLIRRIQAAYRRGARIASICTGVFLLAEAGLLNGKAATTHWRYADLLQKRFPLIDVRPNSLYVDEGQLVTSAGSAAGLDMMLHLVSGDYGPKVANAVAQRLVIPTHRLGDQAQYVARPVATEQPTALTQMLDWVRSHPAQAHTADTMARRASMSVRTLQRQFKETTGLTPIEWLVRERIANARSLLESTGLNIGQVADRSGFGSEESLRRHFRVLTGISPVTYRRQFQMSTSAGR